MLGWDYPHVYPLGGKRFLWLFQDAFVDQPGIASRLDQAVFAHNVALVQKGTCFTLYHRGTAEAPTAFEPGPGRGGPGPWWWPLGGELTGSGLQVFWAEMVQDAHVPGPGDGLGWHPVATWLGTYDARSLRRLAFRPAPNAGPAPLYGYAVSSDATWTYLFGNTFEQNLSREGSYARGPHSATSMWLARVPRGQLDASPEYRTADGWSHDARAARPYLQRYWAENPMQPRFMGGQWVAATKVDGYWGDDIEIDVARDPWGPWTAADVRHLIPRDGDRLMNSYHAHLLPWLGPNASLSIVVSENARNMFRDAYPEPSRYRPTVLSAAWTSAPQLPPSVATID